MPASETSGPLEAALDELYGADPAEFVAVRKRLVGELRAAGDKDAAKSLQTARRPTTAAWALNQMSRGEPELVRELLDRSRDLQAAQSGQLPGGRDAMRDAARAQRDALAGATDAALAVLGERATEAYRARQVLATLQAAAADESVSDELSAGRLVREVSGATGFPEGPNLTLVPDLERATPAPSKPKPKEKPKPPRPKEAVTPAKDDAGRRELDKKEKAEATARRRRELEEAALEQARRRVEEAETAAASAQEAADQAEATAVETRAEVVRLQDELEAARRDARTADDAAARARREATRLARAATKLRSRA